MGELTRQELDAKLDGFKSWIDARFTEQQARIDVRFAEQDAKIEARFAQLDAKTEARFAQQDAKMQKHVVDLIKWMVGTAVTMLAVTVAIFAFMLNVAVNALSLPADSGADANGTSARATPSAVLLHRLQRHHQPRAGGGDPRRHVLHAGVAQVFHPE